MIHGKGKEAKGLRHPNLKRKQSFHQLSFSLNPVGKGVKKEGL